MRSFFLSNQRLLAGAAPSIPLGGAVARFSSEGRVRSATMAGRQETASREGWTLNEPLLHRVAAGEQNAVDECLDRYGNLVWSLARRFTSNRTDAEDAVQEIFIELWSHASRFDADKASETTFVAMLARRRLIDRLRKTKREPTTEELHAAASVEQVDREADLETKDQAARAQRIIEALKPEQQQIIRLAVYDGHTHQSISESLGIPLGTVKTHLRRGLLRVREAMEATA